MPVNIHGKNYVTVAERVEEFNKLEAPRSIETEVLQHEPSVVVKATVTIDGNVFTGISAANPNKAIEKMSPYEVAETSAVGRALGFAGFGIVEGIASADEMRKVEDVAEMARTGTPIPVSKYEEAVIDSDTGELKPINAHIVNEAKKEYKRSPSYKQSLKPRE
ncbi:MAG: hypothetical protein M1320_02790 [Patescibacteria group bacterium]|nr:hypothetical protein [Patescibacteria group bacterium]